MTSHTRLFYALREKGYTIRRAAEEFGVTEEHLGNVALGRTYASPAVRKGLADLGIDLADALPERALSGSYDPRYGQR